MATDFMALPFSRYIAGDYVTPAMEAAWSTGVPYVIVGPGGSRELPPNEPFGGPGAPARRHEILPMVLDDIAQLPGELARAPWDETSSAPPAIHRVDAASYQALTEEAASSRASLFGSLFGRRPAASHLAATLFLPRRFAETFAMTTPFERVVGSVDVAREELAGGRWTTRSASARETLALALDDAARLELPMLVDW